MVTTYTELSKAKQQIATRVVFGPIDRLVKNARAHEPLNALEVLVFLFFGLLKKLQIPDDAAVIILEEWYDDTRSQPQPFLQFVVADNQYCMWTNMTGQYDLKSGEIGGKIPNGVLETVGYNLNELYRRGTAEIRARHEHAQNNSAGSVDQPSHVHQRSPDTPD
jgi:hypothetical protein